MRSGAGRSIALVTSRAVTNGAGMAAHQSMWTIRKLFNNFNYFLILCLPLWETFSKQFIRPLSSKVWAIDFVSIYYPTDTWDMLVLSSSSSSYTIIITGVLPSPSLSRHRGFPSSRRLCLVGQLPPVVRLELKTGRSMPPCITDCVGRHVSYAEILIFCATCCAFTEEAKEVL